MFRRLGVGVFLLTLLVAEGSAHATDAATRTAARELGMEGVTAYQSGDYAKASELLEQAYAVLQVPTLALWSARALERSGKWLEASERFLEATRLSLDGAGENAPQIAAKRDAQTEYDALRARIPKVSVAIEGAEAGDVTVTIDGVEVPRALYEAGRPTNPGEVEVVARRGDEEVSTQVTLEEGERETATLVFGGSAAPVAVTSTSTGGSSRDADDGAPSSWHRPVGWTAVGLGGAGLVFGAVTGFLALDKYGELDTQCPGGTCPSSLADEDAAYDSLRTMSSVGLIAGGVLAAAGVTLLIVAPPKRAEAAYVTPYWGVGSAGVRGTF